jgi:alpha-tubulin suppressor-like RCC1 family protein
MRPLPSALATSILVLASGCILTDPDAVVNDSLPDDASASASASATDDDGASSASGDTDGEGEDGPGTDAGSESADASEAGSGDEDASDSDGDDTGSEGLPSATASAIAVGRLHACALTDAGAVRCWGYSNYGQLGNGAPLAEVAFRTPVATTGLDAGVTAIASFFDHSCALTDAGTMCWGANDYGQLGDGTTSHAAVPVAVEGGEGFTAIATGVGHSCAITSGGGATCWGHNDYGQLGDGSTDDAATPVDVVGLGANVVAIAAGRDHSCAVTSAGALLCWGGDTYGELGDGEPLAASSTPVEVFGSGMVDVAAGDNDSCAIDDGGAAMCWGKNGDGQLGNGASGTLVESHAPTAVIGLDSGVTAIAPGYGYSCAVASGAVLCWGDNLEGNLGVGEDPGYQSAAPVEVVGLGDGGAAVGSCSGSTCALTDAGAVRCWGNNDGGTLGDGSEDSSNVPVDVVSLP